MTVGKAMFYGGIAGAIVSVLLLGVLLAYLKYRRKKIQENLEKKY